MSAFGFGSSSDPRMLLRNLDVKSASEKILMSMAPYTQRLCNLWTIIRGSSPRDYRAQIANAREVFAFWVHLGFVDPRDQNMKNLTIIEEKIMSNDLGNANITEVLAQCLLALLCNQAFPHVAVGTFLNGDCIHVHDSSTTRKYTNLQKLGGGSYGLVMSAKCSNAAAFSGTPEDVAIKTINTAELACHDRDLSTFEARLKREITNLKCISHPNIVAFVDYITLYAGSRLYLVMERCLGDELFNCISERRISIPDIKEGLAQVARALLYLHSCNIIHRDIKPENIGFYKNVQTGEITCKLFDFGLSKKIGNTPSQMGTTRDAGTASYRAPEIASGEAHDFKVDVYSLGITIALCTGREFPVIKDEASEIDWSLCVRVIHGGGHRIVRDQDYDGLPATWLHTSPLMRRLVSAMTRRDAQQRISLAEAMSHEYWEEHVVSPGELAEIERQGAETVRRMDTSEPVMDLF
eukprot:GSChrysophyteH1.ASY1.ANO1.1926.1 assembled CDS